MSLFQKRITRCPRPASQTVLESPWSWAACWPPSTSTMSRASGQKKSTIYGPIGAWRRKRCPFNCFNRSGDQSFFSASVGFFRKLRARSEGMHHPPPRPSPARGEGGFGASSFPPPLRGRVRVGGSAFSASKITPRLCAVRSFRRSGGTGSGCPPGRVRLPDGTARRRPACRSAPALRPNRRTATGG